MCTENKDCLTCRCTVAAANKYNNVCFPIHMIEIRKNDITCTTNRRFMFTTAFPEVFR